MAEVKNSFLQSKMNKDLDDRLIPNGQYRDALNISVGKSEMDNMGVLQNILGNTKLLPDSIVDTTVTCIGAFMDSQTNKIYYFYTNYTDLNPENITLPDSSLDLKMGISVYDLSTGQNTSIVSGIFLNFSTTNLILGVNLVEGLLFWTDNRNQPRKININTALAIPGYYTTEIQISVAKFAPFEPIQLFKKVIVSITDIVDNTYVFTPILGQLTAGMTLVINPMPSNGYPTVVSVEENVFILYTFNPDIEIGDELIFLTSTMTDKSSDPNWPGDPSFLEDKYVRFSYRFVYDDNEYSIIAPFTQIAYIPKQKGYFLNGDESAAYKSTVLSWMENNVNNIDLLIPLPDIGNNIRDTYKITKLEILYKESDSLAIKVLDSIDYVEIRQVSPDKNIYTYPYQSQKPFKTLPEDQTTRVYDNVPVRALAQEIVGNRVVYGNFYNMYSPPTAIDYNTTILPKSGLFTNFIEYPNHTVKQNRNYQVGFVLADKFGRQSSVILSTLDLQTVNVGGTLFGGSTLYASYESENSINIPTVKNWFGNAIVTVVNSTIDSQRDIQAGTPGLYAIPNNGFIPLADSTIITDTTYEFQVDPESIRQSIPVPGEALRGAYTDYVTVLPPEEGDWDPPTYLVRTNGRVNDLYLSNPDNPVDTKFAYTINEIGWYSYRIVIKQQQQEYYNVYLPGMLDGYPSNQTYGSQVTYDNTGVPSLINGINTTEFPIGEEGKTSHIVLINDNINKVPRDLVEVGPDQKLYRSSVLLYGKVENSFTILKLLADDDYLVTNPLATSIVYKLVDNGDSNGIIKTVVSGNGIQSDEANTPVDNPKRWYANTAVVSNEIFSFNVICDDDILSGATNILIQGVAPLYEPITGEEISYEVAGEIYYGEVSSYSVPTTEIILTAPVTVDIPKGTIIKVIRKTHGIITFSPPSYIVAGGGSPYINYTITKSENIQYFPTRKADVVTAIASAADFNFLENNVNNIKGTAGLNFYQLQTKPSIGRVSVVNPIGVVSDKMTPYLSVYETAPVNSALQIFWETTSTGLISDLNYDVLVGYDGPVEFGNINFVFNEDQNPNGVGLDEGEPNSKYITNSFPVLNNTGIPVAFVSDPILVSVFDNSSPNIDVTNKFGVAVGEFPDTIRIFIKESFVFQHNSGTIGSFTFSIKVEWAPGSFITLPVTGRLRNIAPYFLETPEEYSVRAFCDTTVSSKPLVTLTASNGTYNGGPVGQELLGLNWNLIEGNDNNYFSINPRTGVLSLINQTAPTGIYPLKVRLTDAYDFGELVGDPNYFGSLHTDIEFTITIIPAPIPDSLVYETDEFVWNHDTECSGANVPGQGYAAYYIGSVDLTLNTNGINAGLPDITQTSPAAPSKAFQSYVNVGQANGLIFGSANPPIGLTRGTLEWTIKNIGRNLYPNSEAISTRVNKDIYQGIRRQGDIKYILYYRPNSSSAWAPTYDDNGFPDADISGIPVWRSLVDLEMSIYHYTWGTVKEVTTLPSGSLKLIVPEFQPVPKINDFVSISGSPNRYFKILTSILIDDAYVLFLESDGGSNLPVGAGSIVKILRVPENSPGEVLKQTSFTTSKTGEYCLVLKYNYKIESNPVLFTRTSTGILTRTASTLVGSYNRLQLLTVPSGTTPIAGDRVTFQNSINQPITRNVTSVTTDISGKLNIIFAPAYTPFGSGGNVLGSNIVTFRRTIANQYCSTVDFFGKVQTKDAYDYDNPAKYDVAINYIDDYPYSRLTNGNEFTVRTGFDYLVNCTTISQGATSNTIELVDLPVADYLNEMTGGIPPGAYIATSGFVNWAGDPYFDVDTRIVSIDNATKQLILDKETIAPLSPDTKITIFTRPDSAITSPGNYVSGIGTTGEIWSASANGLNINQFYTNNTLTEFWYPYIGNTGVIKSCYYRNSDKNYSAQITDGPITWSITPPSAWASDVITLMPPVTPKPYFVGQVNEKGGMYFSVVPGSLNFRTAWTYNQRSRVSGTNTAISVNNLIDSNKGFTYLAGIGDFVYNITTGKSSQITQVVDNSTLILNNDIFQQIGDSYIIGPLLLAYRGNLYQVKSV